MTSIYSDLPRSISVNAKIKNLFGGFSNQFGWLFFGFGMIFVWVFTMQSDLTSWYHYRGKLAETTGIVNHISTTNMSINGKRVKRYHFYFEDENGREIKAVSYSSTSSVKKNSSVIIEYPVGKPELSRIKGMGNNLLGIFGLFPLVFPIIGSFFIFFGMRKGLKANKLLRKGEFAEGKLISKKMTNTRINNQMVYKFIFSFRAKDGMEYQATARTHLTRLLEDDKKERILYNPKNPKESVLFDSMKARIKITEDGNFEYGSFLYCIPTLLIPGISIIVHGYILLKNLGLLY